MSADPIAGGIAPGEEAGTQGEEETTEDQLEAWFESHSTPRSDAPSTEGEGEGGEQGTEDGATPAAGSPPEPTEEEQEEEEKPPAGGGAPTEQADAFELPETLTINGQTVTRDALENIVGFQQWLAQNPQHLANIDAYVRGEADIAPRQAPTPKTGEEEDDEFVDPRAAEEIAQLREQVGGLTAAQQEQAQQRMLESLETGRQAFAEKYDLEPDAVEALTQSVAAAQVLPAFAARHPGNPGAAFAEALEYQLWNTQSYRDAEFQKLVDQKVQETLQANAEANKRTAKAGSLSGSSGSVPRSDVPKTPGDKQKAMVAEIAQAISENRPG